MGFEQSKDIPGGPLPEWQLFQEKIQTIDGNQKVVGFEAPDGHFYPLENGEELVHIKSEDGSKRETFIRTNGRDIPFETWKQQEKESN